MIFQPVNVSASADRAPVIQQLAQNAAQNVLRRQRMKSLIKAGAAAAGSGTGAGTAVSPFANPNAPRAMGGRAAMPPISQQAMAQMAQAAKGFAGGLAHEQGGYSLNNGRTDIGGGGFDFQSLPDPSAPAHAAGYGTSLPAAAGAGGVGSAASGNHIAGGGNPAAAAEAPGPPNPGAGTQQALTQAMNPYGFSSPAGAAQVAAWGATGLGAATAGALPGGTLPAGGIPIGGGLIYDPTTDSVHGPVGGTPFAPGGVAKGAVTG